MMPGALLLALLRTSLEAGVLLLLLWFACRAWPRMPASARTALWWLGGLRLLAGLIPVPHVPIPFGTPAALKPLVDTPVGERITGAVDVARDAVATPAALAVADGMTPLAWVLFGLAAVWLAGVIAGAAVMARRLIALRRQWRNATPVTDPRVIALQNDWAIVLGRERVPEVRSAPGVTVPVTIGVWRMGVLLPHGSERLSDDTLRLVFAHEMSHIRRRDPLLAWIPALAQLVFWFHPLARLAAREYLAAREEACDVEALRVTGSSPGDYGALLLEFGTGRIAALPGSASCGAVSVRDLKRRLDMLTRSWTISRAHRFAGVLTILFFLALAFAPVRLVANEEGKAAGGHSKTPFSYLLFEKGEDGSRGSVDMRDLDNIRKFKSGKRNPEDLVYFRIVDDAWISRDPALFAEVTAALEPIDRYEAKRAPVEKQRMALEREREKLEARSEDLEQRKERAQERKAALDEARNSGKSERELATMRDDIEADLDDLSDEREGLAREREALSHRFKAVYESDKAVYAQQDRVHQQVLMSIQRIAKKAIDEGRMEPLED
jgi:beta-lactamase regulating signal transducer with metallopeptidase domain